MSDTRLDRRGAFGRVGRTLTGALAAVQGAVARTRSLPPRAELVNAFEYEDVAKLVLPPATAALIAGSDRTAVEQITFRPRMCVPSPDLDITADIFGEPHFTSIIVGPVADQRRFHAEGELATVRGASAANAAVIVSTRTSVPFPQLVAEAKTPLWLASYADGKAETQAQIQQAVAAGCKAVFLTVGGDGTRPTSISRAEWNAVEQTRKALEVPVVVKGVLSVQDAQAAIARGARGIVVSNHGHTSALAPLDVLPAIADAVGGQTTIFVDGSFRRGSDVLKALVLGARGVLVARPVMWGLAAYGAEGVQYLVEMLQSDLARHTGALGAPTLKALTRNMVKIHKKRTLTSSM
jgi:4-hydroxymandelate oxidase